MKKTRLLWTLLAGITPLFTAGCVTRTTYTNMPRETIRFASQSAAETFYNAYLAANYHPPVHCNMVCFGTLPYSHRHVETDNVLFNRAIAAADGDHDGSITDAEARVYTTKATTRADGGL